MLYSDFVLFVFAAYSCSIFVLFVFAAYSCSILVRRLIATIASVEILATARVWFPQMGDRLVVGMGSVSKG